MRDLVIADIHGQYSALREVLEKANYNAQDRLIFLGDVCDRGPQTAECILFLKSLNNFVGIRGNHDDWCLSWLDPNKKMTLSDRVGWTQQGGEETIESISSGNTENEAREFLQSLLPYYECDNCLFVHGGLPTDARAAAFTETSLMWDRNMVQEAYRGSLSSTPIRTEYDWVFCGHTPTMFINSGYLAPITASNVVMCDTGAGYGERLSVIDAKTRELWQVDVKGAQE